MPFFTRARGAKILQGLVYNAFLISGIFPYDQSVIHVSTMPGGVCCDGAKVVDDIIYHIIRNSFDSRLVDESLHEFS